MTSKNAVRAALLACLAVGGLAACGGGADGVSSPGEGVFVPSPPPAPPSPPTSPPPPPPPGLTPAASCPTGFVDQGVITVPGGSLRNCQLPATINTTFGIQAATGVIYSVAGRVDVGVDMGADPAAPLAGGIRGVLNVSPGVTIFGSGGLDHIVVNRGSAINALGTATDPIIFTSRQSVQGSATENSIGQWGGLVILGRAPIAACPAGTSPPNIACVAQVEGTNAFYGGLTSNDNSGQLRFIRVQHSGFEILPNNELNGITLAGIGSGTIIDNVQVHNSSDDGIEIFGGTVNLRNIVLTGNDDDSLDVDTGWRGAVQNLLIVQRSAGGDRGFEFSSAGVRTAQTPPTGQPTAAFTLNTTPFIANATIVARSGGGVAMILNSGNGLRLWNSVVSDPATCLDMDDTDTFTAANGVPGSSFNGVFMTCPTATTFDADADDEATVFNAGTRNTSAGTSTLATRTGGGTSPSTVAFVNGANENAVVPVAVANLPSSTFLTTSTNIGAVNAASSTWYQGWSCSALIGEEAC
jgi:hypothetical protein